MDDLMDSPTWEKQQAILIELTDNIEASTRNSMNHAFRLGVILILIFLVVSLFTMIAYRSITARASRKTQGS